MVVVQLVLMFGSETWVITPHLEKAFEGFHHQAVRQMTVMGPKRQGYETWVYQLIGDALSMVSMDDIGVYISCR